MEPYILLLIVGVFFLAFLATGMPIVFLLGGLSVIFIGLYWGVGGINSMAFTGFSILNRATLFALPLFLFMGYIMQYSGIGDDLFEVMYAWLGRINGGLAIGVIVISTIFAAMVGVAGAATVAMSVVAIPNMARRGYSKEMYIGSVAAGGLLGLLIPPSIEMIVYSTISGASVGALYLGGVVPGLLMAFLFITYIGVRCYFKPSLGPPTTDNISWLTKIKLLRKVVLPVLLVVLILGGIYSGTFTPTEASGMGCTGALLIALYKRTLNRKTLRDSCYNALKLVGMIFWLMIAANSFSQAITATGVGHWMTDAVANLQVPPWIFIVGLMVLLMLMGTMMGDLAIMMIVVPITTPIVHALGIDMTWVGILIVINMITAWLTPPYGTSLFLMRLLVPKGVTMGDIYRSVLPFAGVMFFTLALCAIFPELVLWLPHLSLGG